MKKSVLRSLLKQNFTKTNIRGANLRGANLADANLTGANLRGANLADANLTGAYLTGAYLRGAYLRGANLADAYLRGANLADANLTGANLRGADLADANLTGANLRGANLTNIKFNENVFGIIINCPEQGEFIAYKKCNGLIVTLKILEDSKRSSATSYKCRCSKALVLDIETGIAQIASNYDKEFLYTVGHVVEVANFDENRWVECSTGIHFFMSKEMARQYQI
jgi:hypothetical protein